jgi:type I restriction enzyme R subunit
MKHTVPLLVMLIDISKTLLYSAIFGFTGTPILEENQKKLNTTSTVW